MNKAEYQVYLKSEHWQDFKRKFYLQPKNKFCSKCKRYGRLNIHHLNYKCLGKETDGDVISLCFDCHARTHGIDPYKDYKRYVNGKLVN